MAKVAHRQNGKWHFPMRHNTLAVAQTTKIDKRRQYNFRFDGVLYSSLFILFPFDIWTMLFHLRHNQFCRKWYDNTRKLIDSNVNEQLDLNSKWNNKIVAVRRDIKRWIMKVNEYRVSLLPHTQVMYCLLSVFAISFHFFVVHRFDFCIFSVSILQIEKENWRQHNHNGRRNSNWTDRRRTTTAVQVLFYVVLINGSMNLHYEWKKRHNRQPSNSDFPFSANELGNNTLTVSMTAAELLNIEPKTTVS